MSVLKSVGCESCRDDWCEDWRVGLSVVVTENELAAKVVEELAKKSVGSSAVRWVGNDGREAENCDGRKVGNDDESKVSCEVE